MFLFHKERHIFKLKVNSYFTGLLERSLETRYIFSSVLCHHYPLVSRSYLLSKAQSLSYTL